jgi:hypothetical protein
LISGRPEKQLCEKWRNKEMIGFQKQKVQAENPALMQRRVQAHRAATSGRIDITVNNPDVEALIDAIFESKSEIPQVSTIREWHDACLKTIPAYDIKGRARYFVFFQCGWNRVRELHLFVRSYEILSGVKLEPGRARFPAGLDFDSSAKPAVSPYENLDSRLPGHAAGNQEK